MDYVRHTLNFYKTKVRADREGHRSYSLRGPLRHFQPQTYHPLPLIGACIDYHDTDNLQWAFAFAEDEDAHAYRLGVFNRQLLGAARNLSKHAELLDEVLRQLLPSALLCRPEDHEGLIEGTPDARRYPLSAEYPT